MNPRHLSESSDHFTPERIVFAATKVMGHIDLDPASSIKANHVVQAREIMTRKQDGYKQKWHGRVFLNPPGGKSDNRQRLVLSKCSQTGDCGLKPGHVHEGVESNQKKWWFKLAKEFKSGRVKEAVFVCFSIELLQTTQVGNLYPNVLPIPLDFPICFPSRRIAYDHLDDKGKRVTGKSPPHASCIVYLGPHQAQFLTAFASFGRIK